MRTYEETLRRLAGVHEAQANRAGVTNSYHAEACRAGADALVEVERLRLALVDVGLKGLATGAALAEKLR